MAPGPALTLPPPPPSSDGGGHGNLIGAVAEAGFMLGLEKASGGAGAVLAAAYAPLLVNAAAVPWPTNLVVFDNSRWAPRGGGGTR
jgi:alpha-N-arabinofuranosidase